MMLLITMQSTAHKNHTLTANRPQNLKVYDNIAPMNSDPTLNLPPQRLNWIIIIILSLYPLVGMGIDLIAPSLPAISHSLHISKAITKNLIAIYLFGYAIGNFLIGFLSDTLGRRKLTIMGLLLFTLVSLLPMFFSNAHALLVARFLQGFTLAGFVVTARAMLSDILSPQRLQRSTILINAMWGVGPVFGPVIGGYLQYYFNWQSCFYFFALYGLLGLLGVIFLIPETHFNRQPLNIKQISTNFASIITHRLFMGSVTLMGFLYSALIAFNTLGPFLIQNVLGHTSVYFGHLAFGMGLAFLLGTFICHRLANFYPPKNILVIGIPLFLLIAFLGLIAAYIDGRNIWIITISSLLMFLGCGILYPMAQADGIVIFRHLAGSGSGIMSLINVIITSITAFLMSFISAGSAVSIAVIYLILMILSVMDYWVLVR